MRNNKEYSILFVDDEQQALKYFDKAFSKEFSVLTCDNVVDAKKILDDNSNSIAVLLSDQRMPDQNGTELLSYTRENHPHIIRLLTTAYSDLSEAIAAVNTGEILRYLSKPWDIQVLKAELQYAMRFFMLRHERDQLLKEKLNVKQRLVELNRVRDLIVMASGVTHMRNALHATEAFLTELPKLKESQLADIKSLDIWGLLEKEIKEQLALSETLISRTKNNGAFESNSLAELVEELISNFNGKIECNSISLPEIKFNKELVTSMLSDIMNLLSSTCSAGGKLNVTIESTTDGGKVSVQANECKLTSLLDTPVELLSAFYICYHHGGALTIDASDSISYQITLPSDPTRIELNELAEDWLEGVLQRFEEWPE